jgi:hypothetical protein
MSKIFHTIEKYEVSSFGETVTVSKSTDGDYRCSCGIHSVWSDCSHVRDIKRGTARVVGASRIAHNERYIK